MRSGGSNWQLQVRRQRILPALRVQRSNEDGWWHCISRKVLGINLDRAASGSKPKPPVGTRESGLDRRTLLSRSRKAVSEIEQFTMHVPVRVFECLPDFCGRNMNYPWRGV